MGSGFSGLGVSGVEIGSGMIGFMSMDSESQIPVRIRFGFDSESGFGCLDFLL